MDRLVDRRMGRDRSTERERVTDRDRERERGRERERERELDRERGIAALAVKEAATARRELAAFQKTAISAARHLQVSVGVCVCA